METLRVPQKAPSEQMGDSNAARGHRPETPGGGCERPLPKGRAGQPSCLSGTCLASPAAEACVFASHSHPVPEPLMPIGAVMGRRKEG